MTTRALHRPPVRRRKRCFRDMRRWRSQWVSRLRWVGGRYKARGLRVWKSCRYPYEGRR